MPKIRDIPEKEFRYAISYLLEIESVEKDLEKIHSLHFLPAPKGESILAEQQDEKIQ